MGSAGMLEIAGGNVRKSKVPLDAILSADVKTYNPGKTGLAISVVGTIATLVGVGAVMSAR